MRLVPTDLVAAITWFVYVDSKKVLKQKNVKYPPNNYDAVCSCGYETATNGSNKDVIYGLINHHKINVHNYIYELNCGCTTDFKSTTKHGARCKSQFTNKQLVSN